MASSLLNMSVSNAVTTKLSRTVTGGVASGHDVFSEDVGEKASKTAVCWDAFEHWCAKTVFLSHLYIKHDHFAKTGSGQTWGKLKKRTVFPQVAAAHG